MTSHWLEWAPDQALTLAYHDSPGWIVMVNRKRGVAYIKQSGGLHMDINFHLRRFRYASSSSPLYIRRWGPATWEIYYTKQSELDYVHAARDWQHHHGEYVNVQPFPRPGRPQSSSKLGMSPITMARFHCGPGKRSSPITRTMSDAALAWPQDHRVPDFGKRPRLDPHPARWQFVPWLVEICHEEGIANPHHEVIARAYVHWLRAVRAHPDGARYQSLSRTDFPLTLRDAILKVHHWSGGHGARGLGRDYG